MGVRAAPTVRLLRRGADARTRTSGWPTTTSSRPAAPSSQLLEAEIERPRLGPMRDIVATIQPEQDEHRARRHRDHGLRAGRAGHRQDRGRAAPGRRTCSTRTASQLSRQGVLVVGPNTSFLRYIGDVLPALGEIDVRQTTVEELCGQVRVRADGRPGRWRRLKGDARMAEVLRRPLWAQLRARRRGAGGAAGRPAVAGRRRPGRRDRGRADAPAGVRYGAGRALLPQRLANAVLVRMEQAGESPDDRVQDAVARSKPVRRMVRHGLAARSTRHGCCSGCCRTPQSWPAAPTGSSTPTSSRRCSGRPRPAAPGSARWSLADAVLVDEVADLVDRHAVSGHVVLDEAQDLSPMHAARGRPAMLDRFGHRARRHRPGRPRRGAAATGTPRWATSASPMRTSRCSPRASGSRPT